MDIKTIDTYRADGRFFEKLLIEGVATGQNVAPLIDENPDLRLAPCILERLGGEAYVASVPDCFRGDTSYELGLFDGRGLCSSTSICTIAFERSKRKPLFGRVPATDEDLSAAAKRGVPQNPFGYIVVNDMAPTPVYVIAHLSIYIQDTDSGNLRVRVLDKSFKTVSSTFTLVGESLLELSEYSSDTGTLVNVSVPIPWNLDDIFIVAWDDNRPDHFVQRHLPKKEWEGYLASTDDLLYNDASRDPSYPFWFEGHKLNACDARRQRSIDFPDMPKFSLIVPLYKTPIGFFNELVNSVKSQTYSNWECVLANSTPEDSVLSARIEQVAASDSRFRAVTLEKNLGISLNTNAGVARSTGDFLCFLDHDDVLEPDILFEYARAVNERPDTDVLYCDEDKLGEDGALFEATFKCDFSLDLLRSNNYICHMLCIRKSLFERLEPNTPEFDGAQDYNILLEAVEQARHVHHVAKILYHWRVCETSTAGGNNAKPYASKAGLRALKAHLDRVGVRAVARELDDLKYRYSIRYAVPEERPLVSIVILNTDHADRLKTCVDSICRKSTYENFEIVVVEGGSTDPDTFEYYRTLAEEEGVRIVSWAGGRFDYSGAINFGRSAAKGDYLVFLSNGAEIITPDWIELLLGNCARGETGAVGCKLLEADGFVQSAGMFFADEPGHWFAHSNREDIGYLFFLISQRNCSAVSDACLMVKAADFDNVGGFDNKYSSDYAGVDFCLRLTESGKLNVYVPYAELSNRSLSPIGERGVSLAPNEPARFTCRWSGLLAEGDPNYNRNLRKNSVEAAHWKL